MVKVTVKVFPKGEKTLEMQKGATYEQLVLRLGLSPETVVVFRDGAPVPIDGKIEKGEIRVIRVVSGG